MSYSESLQFLRGFLLSEQPVSVPSGYVAGPLLENFYVHT